MYRHVKSVGAMLTAGILLLSACGAPKETPTATPDPNMLLTAAVQTVQVELTRSAALTPSATPTATIEPTATLEPTKAVTVQPTSATTANAVGTATLNAPVTSTKPDKAEWVQQDPTDGEKLTPGQTFDMIWHVKNTGTTTWTTGYLLRFFAGSQMGAPAVVAFPRDVKPNEELVLTVKMTAPAAGGTYTSWWKLTNAAGGNFYDVSVSLEVTGAAAPTATSVPPTSIPASTALPTSATP